MRSADSGESIAPDWLGERLAVIAAEHGQEMTPDGLERLARFASSLLRWNRRINLTGARTAEDLVDEHLADGIVAASALPPAPCRGVDVGSGGGLPGLVIAALLPEIELTLLEPIQKKHTFLQAMRRELALDNVTCRRARLAEWRGSDDFQLMDFALSRATWPLLEWLDLGLDLVHAGGLVIGLEGGREHALPPGATRRAYRIGDRERALVLVERP